MPYIPTGQFDAKTAYRKNLKGIINAPAFLFPAVRQYLGASRGAELPTAVPPEDPDAKHH